VRAWQVTGQGEPVDVMRLVDVPDLTPGPKQVVVDVRAAAANFPDILMCRGIYQEKPPLPFTPGIEVCGTVTAVGDGVEGIEIGSRVLGDIVLPNGGYAEQAIMPMRGVFTAPPELDDAEAAALYVAYQTGWFGLHHRAHLQPGETLLVHAAAGGVGSAAVQLGKAAGATVIAVVGSADKVQVAIDQGADVVVDRSTQDFVDVVKDVTDGRGADVVYDPVGGDVFRRSTKCIAFEGRILVIGFASGDIADAATNHVLIKNYSVVGLHWANYRIKRPDLVRHCHDELLALSAAGAIKPLVSERVPLEDVSAMLGRLASGSTTGRVVWVSA